MNQIKEKTAAALQQLIAEDSYLLVQDVNERSISHKLAGYLEQRFEGWDVDCEYNRNHDDPKRLNIPRKETQSNDTHATTVFPDIIVHRRHTDQNLLVIEINKSTNRFGDDYDLQKLEKFKQELGYQYAVFIKLRAGNGEAEVQRMQWL